MAVLIAVATVYGRYHYLSDAAAGLLVALIALAISDVTARITADTRSGGTVTAGIG
jgi:membrane-associated phospholipid phosphatase